MYAQPILCLSLASWKLWKQAPPAEVPHFLWRRCFPQRKSWEDDLFSALNTRLDKCNDIQMSTTILCLWGALSNWILIKYWEREMLYLIMKAAPLLLSSGEPAVCSTQCVLGKTGESVTLCRSAALQSCQVKTDAKSLHMARHVFRCPILPCIQT